MVIGIDAGMLSVRDDRLKVGVYRVVRETLRALAALDRENSYRLYSFGEIGPPSLKLRRVNEVVLPRVGWSKVWLPIELHRCPVDVFLGFGQALPFSKTSYNIGFIYDLGFLYHPEVYGSSAKTLKFQTDTLVRRADHIITISHATKADVIRAYGLESEKITVAYPGVRDTAFCPSGDKYVGPKPYFLFVGSLNKAKDIPTLLESFANLPGYDLYLVGGNYWPDPAIEEAIKEFHLEDRVKKIGFVTDTELPKYYRGALAFVTTALQEGFCLPAAESMACGTPVVALDRGALKEIIGDGGIIVTKTENGKRLPAGKAGKTDTFAEAMEIMTDQKERQKFTKKAIEQAKKFRWKSFAQQILRSIHYGHQKD